MHKSATKCNETIGKWCKNKHRASKIIDTFETYQVPNWTVKDHQHRAASRHFSGAVAGEKEDFCKVSFACTSFTLF
jgi:hypothetical protein